MIPGSHGPTTTSDTEIILKRIQMTCSSMYELVFLHNIRIPHDGVYSIQIILYKNLNGRYLKHLT